MALNISPELEDLIKCGCCHLLFNDTDAVPKIFNCRHYFCLKCVNSLLCETNSNEKNEDNGTIQCKTTEVYCIHCWKRTEIYGENDRGDNLPTHTAILYLSKYLNNGFTDNIKFLKDSYMRNKEDKNVSSASNKSVIERPNGICHKPKFDSLSSVDLMSSQLNQLNELNHHKLNNMFGDKVNNNFACNGMIERQFLSSENCLIHAMPNTLWCNTCNSVLCRGCAAGEEHRKHIVKSQIEAKEFIQSEIAQELQYMNKSMEDLHNLMVKQRNFLLKILECCIALKSHIEMELVHHRPTVEMAELHETMTKFQLCLEMLDQQTPKEAFSLYASVQNEKLRLTVKQRELLLQYKLNEGMRNCNYLFDYDILKQILMQLSNYAHQTGDTTIPGAIERKSSIRQEPNGLLLLTNYCVAQMYSKHSRFKKQEQQLIPIQQSLQKLHLSHYTTANPPNKQQCSMIPNNLLQTMISNVNMPPGLSTRRLPNETCNNDVTTSSGYMYNTHDSLNSINNNNNNNSDNYNNDNNSGNNHIMNNSNTNRNNHSANNNVTVINRTTSYAQALLQNQSTKHHQHYRHHPNENTSTYHTHTTMSQQQNSLSDAITVNTSKTTSSNNLKECPDLIAPFNNLGNSNVPSITIPATVQTTAIALNLFNQNDSKTTEITSMANNYFYNTSTTSDTINDLVYSLNQLQKQQDQQEQEQQQQQLQKQQNEKLNSTNLLINPNIHIYPIYYFNIEMNCQAAGRILIEVRNDIAPKMAKNFNALVTHELGFGYKGCHIFQCWENESIITGDYEHNNGRGGRSVYDEFYFMPDDTKILAVRGAVGMRRSQRRHDNLGLVGSQFRIILREMRCFTGIFAFVIEGLDLVDKISQTGDTSGKPKSNAVVVNCGKYQMN